MRKLGARPTHQTLGRFLEQARRLTRRVLHDLAARGIRRITRDAGKPERDPVDERGMAARVLEDHRVARARRVQRSVKRDPFDVRLRRARPFLLMPAASLDQRPRLGAPCRIANLRHDVIPGVRFGEIEHELRFAKPGVVTVTVDESRNRETSLEIDHPRLRSHPALDLGVAAHCCYAIPAHGDRLRAGMLRIDSKEVPVEKNEIGTSLLCASGVGRDRAECDEKEARLVHGSSESDGW